MRDALRICGVLQKEVRKGATHLLLHHGLHFAGDKLVLGLGGEFRIGDLHGNDRRESFPSVVSRHANLGLLAQAFLVNVVVKGPRQGRPEARDMGASVALGNVVGIGKDVFLETVIPLHSDLNGNAILFSLRGEVEGLGDHFLVGIEVVHKCPQPAIIEEDLFPSAALIG